MSRTRRTVVAVPPARPVLQAGDEIDWHLEQLLREPEDRTGWLAFRDHLQDAGWSELEAYRCVRRCQRYAIQCAHVAHTVGLLTSGRHADGMLAAVDIHANRPSTTYFGLPIHVVEGSCRPTMCPPLGQAGLMPPTRIIVGDRWVRYAWRLERYTYLRDRSPASLRGATPRARRSARQR